MKFKILTATIMLALTPVAQAMSEKPKACPNVDAIKTAGLGHHLEHDRDGWTAFNGLTRYDETGNLDQNGRAWSFAVTDIQADNQEDAYKLAQNSLASLQFHSGPFQVPMVDEWGCYYLTDEGYRAIAFTNQKAQGAAKVARAMR